MGRHTCKARIRSSSRREWWCALSPCSTSWARASFSGMHSGWIQLCQCNCRARCKDCQLSFPSPNRSGTGLFVYLHIACRFCRLLNLCSSLRRLSVPYTWLTGLLWVLTRVVLRDSIRCHGVTILWPWTSSFRAWAHQICWFWHPKQHNWNY